MTIRTGVILPAVARGLVSRRWAVSAIATPLRCKGRGSLPAVGDRGAPRQRVRDRGCHHLHDDEESRAPGGGPAVHSANRGGTLLSRHQRRCVAVAGRMPTGASFARHAAGRGHLLGGRESARAPVARPESARRHSGTRDFLRSDGVHRASALRRPARRGLGARNPPSAGAWVCAISTSPRLHLNAAARRVTVRSRITPRSHETIAVGKGWIDRAASRRSRNQPLAADGDSACERCVTALRPATIMLSQAKSHVQFACHWRFQRPAGRRLPGDSARTSRRRRSNEPAASPCLPRPLVARVRRR